MARRTAYEISGKGPTVILVHGLGLNRHMWQWQRDALTPHFSVVQYDLLGHGESAKPPGPYRMRQMVEQITELMADLDIESAALVGFSLGGLIVRAFCLAHPQRVCALAILSSAHARSPEDREAIMTRVRQVERAGPEATVSDALARWFSGEFAQAHPQVLEQIRGWILANDHSAYPALYRLFADGDIGLETAIAAIECPTLIMTGEEDYGNSPQMAQQMAELIPNSRVEILRGLKHMALAEDPARVNSLLVSYLRSSSQQKC